MHSCRRRLRCRLNASASSHVLPQVLGGPTAVRRPCRQIPPQRHRTPPYTQPSLRLTTWPQQILAEAEGKLGSLGGTSDRATARAQSWSVPSETGIGGVVASSPPSSSRQQGARRHTRRISTGAGAAAERRPVPPPLASLQERLGISDAEAETIQSKEQTTNTGFKNLTSTGGRSGGTGQDPGAALGSSSYPCFPSFLLDGLRAAPADVRSLVLRRPVVLGWSAGAAEKVSRWLRENLGMRRSEVARLLLRHPEAGTKSVESNVEVKAEWLRDNLDLGGAGGGAEDSNRGVVKVLLRAPQILNLSVERSLEPMLRWLEDRLRVSREEAARIARDNPALFWRSVESNLEPTLAWVQERLGMDEASVLRMVAAAPNILSLNVQTGLEPKIAWLRDRVGLSRQQICEIVGREPTILYKSVDDNLEPTLAWLKTQLGLDDREAREMFVAFPRLVGSSLGDNLKLKIPWLREALGLDTRGVVALAKRSPAILQYSIKGNLEPTFTFFREDMNASREELTDAVVRNPKLLAYSLEGRLRPRVAAMRRANLEPTFSEHRHLVCRWDDAKFEGFIKRHGH